MEYRVHARRIDAHGSLATAKQAEVTLDTDLAGRRDAMNPVELLLSALAACMLKGIERVTPMLHFQIDGAEVRLEAVPGRATQTDANPLRDHRGQRRDGPAP